MADNEEAHIDDAHRLEFLFDLSEQGDILLNGEPANVTEDDGVFVQRPRSRCGGELFGFHSTLHEEAGPSGGLLEHGAELFVGGVENFGEPVKARGDPESSCLDVSLDGVALSFLNTVR